MVSKLLLAVQENAVKAFKTGDPCAEKLKVAYYDVRSGLGFNKEPSLYGAFPFDPYSHTPFGRGAKQPGMTGQVKEEILTRFGELGVFIEDGKVSFSPVILKDDEIKADGTLSFTLCGTPITYSFSKKSAANIKDAQITVNGNKRAGNSLTEEETKKLFERGGKITSIEVSY